MGKEKIIDLSKSKPKLFFTYNPRGFKPKRLQQHLHLTQESNSDLSCHIKKMEGNLSSVQVMK